MRGAGADGLAGPASATSGRGAPECGAACGVFLTSWLEYLIISVNLVLLIFQARAMVPCLSILLGLVLFRECLQMMVSLKRYIFDLENWLEMATLLLTGR